MASDDLHVMALSQRDLLSEAAKLSDCFEMRQFVVLKSSATALK